MPYAYIPETLDLTNIPSNLTKFEDDICYFIHKIYEQKIFKIKDKSEYVPLKADYLRKVVSFRKLSLIKDFLIKREIVETDNYYIKGKKAIGYRLGPKYRGVPHKKVLLTNKRLIKNIEKLKNKIEIELDVHKFLHENLLKIRIDETAMNEIIPDDFMQELTSITLLRDKSFFFVIDKFGRVHTNITNLKSKLRKYLRIDNQKLMEIDIVNSQPYFMGVILCKLRNVFSCMNNTSLFLNNIIYNTLRCDILSDDEKRYLELVSSGDFYEYLANKSGITLEGSARKKFKVKLFSEVFFRKYDFKSKYADMFATEFPSVWRLILDLKKRDYRFLSRLLQRTESDLIINQVVRRCMEQKLFVTTIHDSVLCLPHDVNTIKNIMLEEFGVFRPILKIKKY